MLLVTHSPDIMKKSDKIVVLNNGTMERFGPPTDMVDFLKEFSSPTKKNRQELTTPGSIRKPL